MATDAPGEARLNAVADYETAMHMVNTILDLVWKDGADGADMFVVARACVLAAGILLREDVPAQDRRGWLRVFRDEMERVMFPVGRNADGTSAKIH